MTKLFTLFMLLCIYSCSNPKNAMDDKLFGYLQSLSVDVNNSSVTIVDPAYCGSCTQETVNWLIEHAKANDGLKKYILTTSEIPKELAEQIPKNYQIIFTDKDKIARLGFGGAVSTNIIIMNNNIYNKTIIKGL